MRGISFRRCEGRPKRTHNPEVAASGVSTPSTTPGLSSRVGTEGLGHEACQAQRSAEGQSRGRPQARSPCASYVDRRDRVQLVDEEACGVACTGEITGFPRHSGKRRPCRDDGGGEIARCLACTRKGDRAFNIDPPTSSYAIMRRARPYRGENSGPGKERFGELDTKPRN